MATLTKEQVRQIIARAPEGTSPAGVVAALRQTHQLEGYDDSTDVSRATMSATNNPAASRMAGMKDRALKLLPDVGGAVGGMVGGAAGLAATAPIGGGGAIPGAMVGAAVGGGAGEALRQVASGEPLSRREIEKRAGAQGLYEGAGGGLAKGAGHLALPIMSKALGNVAALAKRFNTTSEKIARLVLDEGLPVTEAGAQQAIGKGSVIRSGRNARIAATPGTVGARALAAIAISDAEKNLGRRMTRNERAVIVSKIQDEANAILTDVTHGAVPKAVPGTPARPAQPASATLDQWGNPATPAVPAQPAGAPPPSRYSGRETEQVKEVAAKNARPEYRASQAAASVAADPSLSKKLAKAARERLEKIPGVKADNAKIKDLMVAEQAITNAVVKGSEEWTPLHVGPMSVGLKVPHKTLSNIAHFLNSAKVQAALRQSPRAVAAALVQLMHTDSEPDRTRAVAKARQGRTPDGKIVDLVKDKQGNMVPVSR